MPEIGQQREHKFSQETIDALVSLGIILSKIRKRMLEEGYAIIDGKIIHLESGKEYVPRSSDTAQ